jgi:hypothetical protein
MPYHIQKNSYNNTYSVIGESGLGCYTNLPNEATAEMFVVMLNKNEEIDYRVCVLEEQVGDIYEKLSDLSHVKKKKEEKTKRKKRRK